MARIFSVVVSFPCEHGGDDHVIEAFFDTIPTVDEFTHATKLDILKRLGIPGHDLMRNFDLAANVTIRIEAVTLNVTGRRLDWEKQYKDLQNRIKGHINQFQEAVQPRNVLRENSAQAQEPDAQKRFDNLKVMMEKVRERYGEHPIVKSLDGAMSIIENTINRETRNNVPTPREKPEPTPVVVPVIKTRDELQAIVESTHEMINRAVDREQVEANIEAVRAYERKRIRMPHNRINTSRLVKAKNKTWKLAKA